MRNVKDALINGPIIDELGLNPLEETDVGAEEMESAETARVWVRTVVAPPSSPQAPSCTVVAEKGSFGGFEPENGMPRPAGAIQTSPGGQDWPKPAKVFPKYSHQQ